MRKSNCRNDRKTASCQSAPVTSTGLNFGVSDLRALAARLAIGELALLSLEEVLGQIHDRTPTGVCEQQ